jgi:peptidoglycan/LPS O-acetylase OafA/YrhL
MKHIPQLDGIRGLAVLAVFIHHAFKTPGLWIGVDLFFVLSGFLITGVLLNARTNNLREYIGGFYSRRARRLALPYLSLLLVFTLAFGASWMRHGYMYFGLMNFLRPMGVAVPGPLLVLWSLAVEEQFYCFWPLAVFFLNDRHLRWLALFLVALAPFLRGMLHFHNVWPVYMLMPFRMDLLVVGALLALHWRGNRASIERWGAKIGLAMIPIGLAIPLILHWWVSKSDLRVTHPVLCFESTLISCLGAMLWALSGWQVGLLKFRPLMYMGKISYTFYLFHTLALRLVHSALGGFAITVLLAALSWTFIESPLLRKRTTAEAVPIIGSLEAA